MREKSRSKRSIVIIGIVVCLCFTSACEMSADNNMLSYTVQQESNISDDSIIRKSEKKWVKVSSKTYSGSGENADQLFKESNYEYDDRGRLIKNVMTVTNVMSEPSVWTNTYEYELDNEGRLIKRTSYADHGDGIYVSGCYGYEYGMDGKTSKYIEYRRDDCYTIESWDEYERDMNGNKIKSTKYYVMEEGDVLTSWKEYEYENGDNTRIMLHYPDEYNRHREKTYVMEYDDAHNMLKETEYDADGAIFVWTEYEYDSSGNEIKESAFSDIDILYIKEYEYDDYGNQIKEKIYDKDGTLTTYTLFEYTQIPIND